MTTIPATKTFSQVDGPLWSSTRAVLGVHYPSKGFLFNKYDSRQICTAVAVAAATSSAEV